MDSLTIQILIPAYNEGRDLYENTTSLLTHLDENSINFKLTLVNDGSKDNTQDIIDKLAYSDKRISGYPLAKHRGKDFALMSAICEIEASYYLVLDSDIQLPMSYIKQMVDIIKGDPSIDIISAERQSRISDAPFYRFIAIFMYHIIHIFTNVDMRYSTDYKLFNSKCANYIKSEFQSGNFYFRWICEQLPVKYAKIRVYLVKSNRKSRFGLLQYIRQLFNVISSIVFQRRLQK